MVSSHRKTRKNVTRKIFCCDLGAPDVSLEVFSDLCAFRFCQFQKKRLREMLDSLYADCFFASTKRSGRILHRVFMASSLYALLYSHLTH